MRSRHRRKSARGSAVTRWSLRARQGRGVGGTKSKRGGAVRRKRLEARAVPGCSARRALRPLPPSCWRKRGERQRGPPASRPGQCVRARGAVSARLRAQPPPPNGHVGAPRCRHLPSLLQRTGLSRGPPAACARPAQPRRLGRSPFLLGLGLRRSSPPVFLPLRPRPCRLPALLCRGARSM